MNPKKFYRNYVADNVINPINETLLEYISKLEPKSVIEFGSGQSKHLSVLQKNGISCFGLDISFQNLIHAHVKGNCDNLALGDEAWLSHLRGFDVAFTCSVLDHIPDIKSVVFNLKRCASHVICMETHEIPGEYYYEHNYAEYGFVDTGIKAIASGNKCEYTLWHWKAD